MDTADSVVALPTWTTAPTAGNQDLLPGDSRGPCQSGLTSGLEGLLATLGWGNSICVPHRPPSPGPQWSAVGALTSLSSLWSWALPTRPSSHVADEPQPAQVK